MNEEMYVDYVGKIIELPIDELDEIVSPSFWNRRMPRIEICNFFSELMIQKSVQIEKNFSIIKNLPYGTTDRQRYDIIYKGKIVENSPVLIGIHGGYFQANSKEVVYNIAKPIVENGGIVVTLDYDLTPEVSITEIVRQIRLGVKCVIEKMKQYNCRSIYLIGHSCGAHLAFMSLNSENENKNIFENVEGIISVCGTFDLSPLFFSYENVAIKMTKEEADENTLFNGNLINSFIMNLNNPSKTKILFAVAEYDTPWFQKQSYYLNQILENITESKIFVGLGLDHFNIFETLDESNSLLAKQIIEMMNLKDS